MRVILHTLSGYELEREIEEPEYELRIPFAPAVEGAEPDVHVFRLLHYVLGPRPEQHVAAVVYVEASPECNAGDSSTRSPAPAPKAMGETRTARGSFSEEEKAR